jgi:uncharacterized sulfatase
MNFLLITSDQQRWDAIGSVNSAIRTPNLDALAREGIRFEQAYTVNPVCTPSRCSMLTGQYPSRHGCWHVGTSLPADYTPSVAGEFSRAGYFTALLGKSHFRPCRDPQSFEAPPHIHDLDFFRRWSGPYHGFEYAQLVIGHTCEPHACGMHYGAWLADQGVNLKDYFDTHSYTDFGQWELPAEFHGSKWVADMTIDAMDRAAQQRKPFFLWSSFQDPHNPYIVPAPWDTLHPLDNLPAPAPMRLKPNDKPDFYKALSDGIDYDKALPALSNRGWGDCGIQPCLSVSDIRKLYQAYYGMVALMDHHIGRIIAALRDRGQLENTVIVFTTDHGDYLGHHGLWGKGLPIYDDIQRLPFIVRHPDCLARGQASRAIQSLVDIPVTLLSLAGLPVPETMQGVSQARAWADASKHARDAAIVEFRPSQGEYMQWTIVDAQHKLAVYETQTYGELYDVICDPDFERNLFDAPEARDIRARLLSSLQPHIEAARRTGLIRERVAGS